MALAANEIIKQLKDGKKFENLKTKVTWESLSPQDRTALLEKSRQWQDEEAGYEILRILYDITPKTEYSFRIKVLIGVVLRTDKGKSINKDNILKLIKRDLDSWRDSLTGSRDQKRIELYHIHEADYNWLCGYVLEEQEDYALAKNRYQEALRTYQKLDYQNGIQRATQKLADIEKRKPDDPGAVPIEVLQNSRTMLKEEVAKLTQEAREVEQLLEAKKNELKEQSQIVGDLQQKVSELSSEVSQSQNKLSVLSKEIQEKELEKGKLESGLQFLTTLPKVAMAPLWVEIVRLALEKGRMDSFTIQAIKRLSIDCPQDALPLLAEIAARCQEPFTVDTTSIQSGMAHWFSLIAEARSLQQEDEILAAQKMVDAWAAFFAMAGERDNHA
jgi:DNA repair exonuclease SbcCD ATPase subunit